MRWWFRNNPDSADQAEVDQIVTTFGNACAGAGVCRMVSTVSGTTEVLPRITYVQLGPPMRLTVRMPTGLLWTDIRDAADRLAPHLGAYGLRVQPRGRGEWALVELLDSDPLNAAVLVPDRTTADSPVMLGQDENGDPVTVAIDALGHAAIQGQTGAGKSVTCYSILAQLADRQRCGYPLTVTGIDPSGILLRGYPGAVLGMKNPVAVEAFLTKAVQDMDDRIAAIPHDRDSLPIDQVHPLRFVVCEELPGLWRWLDAVDAKAAKRCRAMLARLLAEGRKAGYRIVLVAQRAESAAIGATERAQCSVRVSHRVDTVDALRMLHPDADPATAEAHSRAEAGIALVSVPGRPLTRIRAPYLPYGEYVRRTAPEGVAA